MSYPRPRFLLRFASLIVAIGAALALLPALAAAQTITVNTTADNAPNLGACGGVPGDCSLRQALNAANFSAEPTTIVLPAGHYTLTIKGEDDEGNKGDLDFVEDTETTIEGSGARTTVIDASELGDRVFQVHPRALLRLSRLTVTGGHIDGEYGGGIETEEESSIELDDVAVRGNVAGKSGRGGGLALEDTKARITDSLIAENRNSGDGGGVWTRQGETTMINTTIADNKVETALNPGESWGAYGGGWEMNGGVVTLQNVTIAGNSILDNNGGSEGSGTGVDGGPEIANIVNTVIAGNTGENVEELSQCESFLESTEGHNLEQPRPGAEEEPCFASTTDLAADALFGAFGDNGGETDTVALLPGSPAINAADASKCPATDQRGLPRPALGGCDIGAFELQPAPPAKPITPPPPALTAPTIKRKGKVIVKKAGKTFLVKPGFTVACPATDPTCTGSIKVRAPKLKIKGAGTSAAKKVLIGKAKFSVLPGKTKKLSLKLNAKGAKMLRALGKVRGSFEVSSRAGTGPVGKAKATLKLKLPPVHHRH